MRSHPSRAEQSAPLLQEPKADDIPLLPAHYPWKSKLRSIYSYLSHA